MNAMPDDATRRSDPAADPVYIHKPSLMGAPWELRLRPEALEWRTGRHEGRIAYARVTRVRLSFRPVRHSSASGRKRSSQGAPISEGLWM